MTTYLASYLPALQSILPRSAPTPSSVPSIGASAPSSIANISLPSGTGSPTLIAFPRHCGCPFAAKEVRSLIEQLDAHPDLRVIIVQHSTDAEIDLWLSRIGSKDALTSKYADRCTLVADPDRNLYAEWGIGTIGWTSMVNGELMGKIKVLRTEGIDLTQTGKGSWRWGNSGGFAVDGEGKVRWRKVAEDAGDMCDYGEAAKTLYA